MNSNCPLFRGYSIAIEAASTGSKVAASSEKFLPDQQAAEEQVAEFIKSLGQIVESKVTAGATIGDFKSCMGITEYDQRQNWQTCANAKCVCLRSPGSKLCTNYKKSYFFGLFPGVLELCKNCASDWEAAGYSCNRSLPQ